ncbi:Aspartokinase [Ascosphaera pollenicola]|nr:Aspartokinase [Ascosphaera pollenicola]
MSSSRPFSSYLVTPAELNEALTDQDASRRTVPLCAAWFMPNDPQKRTGLEAFKRLRIPQARFLDIDKVKDPDSIYPHMLPTSEMFESAMQELGIKRDDQIVVYDSEETGLFSAPRVGWTLKLFGHEKVHILNNFRLWVKEGYPVESGELDEAVVPEKRSNYTVSSMKPELVVNYAEMKQIANQNLKAETEAKEKQEKEGDEASSSSSEHQILDARPVGRFAGIDPEPRVGLRSGHIPGSISVPFNELLDPQTKTLLPSDQLRQIFEAKGVKEGKPTISSCGTGVTAAVVDLALEQAGYVERDNRRIYDGSWT